MRPGFFAAAVLLVVSIPLGASAAPRPTPSDSAAAAAQPHDGGVIEGIVTGVDYGRGTVTVGGGRDATTITVTPGTSVQSDDPGYHAFSDVAKGSRVQIFASRMAGKVVAQIIRLLKR